MRRRRGGAIAALAWLAAAPAATQAQPTAEDIAYDARIRAAAAAARGFEGPLEGRWVLTAGGRELYALQFADRDGELQGAWRDLRRPGALEGSGYLDLARRTEAGLVLSFTGAFAVLRPEHGRWTGELTEGDRKEPAALERREP